MRFLWKTISDSGGKEEFGSLFEHFLSNKLLIKSYFNRQQTDRDDYLFEKTVFGVMAI